LGPDVAEDDVDLPAERDVDGHDVELDHAATRVHPIARGDRQRIAVVIDERDDRV
jgi:hypothetical protein